MVRQVGVADTCADRGSAICACDDIGELQVSDIDQRGRVLDVVLHQVDQIGSAAEKLRALLSAGVDGLVR